MSENSPFGQIVAKMSASYIQNYMLLARKEQHAVVCFVRSGILRPVYV